jgi:hypothetical protein
VHLTEAIVILGGMSLLLCDSLLFLAYSLADVELSGGHELLLLLQEVALCQFRLLRKLILVLMSHWRVRIGNGNLALTWNRRVVHRHHALLVQRLRSQEVLCCSLIS